MWFVKCPKCLYYGSVEKDFDMSCSDECFCPRCGESFVMEYEIEDDDDREYEDEEEE